MYNIRLPKNFFCLFRQNAADTFNTQQTVTQLALQKVVCQLVLEKVQLSLKVSQVPFKLKVNTGCVAVESEHPL